MNNNAYSFQLEADTQVIFHTNHADSIDPGNIAAHGNGTDIPTIHSCNVGKLEKSHLW